MEKQLFDWFEWDVIDDGVFQFYNCTVKNIPDYKPGTKISTIVMNYQNGTMTFMDEHSQEMKKFNLQFLVSVSD
jgi:hypothetical protein